MTAMPEPDYVVVRAAADLPHGFIPKHLDGKWFDRATMPTSWGEAARHLGIAQAVAVPTGRFEVRDDGAVAEVWEMQL